MRTLSIKILLISFLLLSTLFLSSSLSRISAQKNLRDKALIACLAQGGQRRAIYSALKWGHVRREIERGVTPILITVREVMLDYRGVNVNKAEVKYMFALGRDAVEYIKLMMEERRRNGEPIDDDSWLFRSYSRYVNGKPVRAPKTVRGPPLAPIGINRRVVALAKKAGIRSAVKTKTGFYRYEVHAHVFRRYWKAQLRRAGVKDTELINFMMGHKPPYEGAYDKFFEMPEYIRREYAKAEPFLSLKPVSLQKEAIILETLRTVAEGLGLDPARIKIERERKLGRPLTMDEEVEAIRLSIKRLRKVEVLANGGASYESKIVTENELTKYIDLGWEHVGNIGNGKYLIRRARAV